MADKATVLKDPLKGATQEFLQDPYPIFRRFREEEPLFWSEEGKYWIVSRYADVHSILKDLHYEKRMQRWRVINPAIKALAEMSGLMKSQKGWMLNQDPPDHTRLRSLVQKAFTPKMINQMRPHIEEIANNLIDEVEAKGDMDIVADYAFPLPVTVIAEMLGVPSSDRDRFHEWSTAMTESLEPSLNLKHQMKIKKAIGELTDYLRPLVAERRKNPKEDLISVLVQAEEEGDKLTEDELLGNCVLLLVAGHETTVNLIGNAVRCLLTYPEQRKLLEENPDLLPNAITEVLRFESPVQMIRRLAGENMELHGKKIREHDMFVLLTGSANRDSEQFENPDNFDITRQNTKHLAFGYGIHHCIGSSLAEAEGQIAISTLFKRLPNIKLKANDVQIRKPFALRGPKYLPVTF